MSFHDSLRNASQQMRVRWARSRWRTRRRGPFGSQRSGESVGLSRLNRAPNRDSRRIQSTYSTASADVKSILRSRPAGRLRGEGGGTRCVYVNLPAPKNATSRHGTVTNKIRTAKYTLFTFLPKNLFEQFRRAANIYFLFMAALQVIPYFQVSSVFMTLFPICFVLSVTAAKDGFEDWKRHQQDREFNNTPTSTLQRWRNVNFEREDDPPPGWRGWVERVRRRLGLRKTEPAVASSMYTSSTDAPLTGHAAPAHSPSSALRRMNTYMPEEAAFQPAVWKDVRIGDIILLHNNDPVPADMVILSTSEPDNECYIETKNLDGETNLKTRRGVQETAYITDAIECARAQFYIESEPPTSNLYLYRGTLHMAREDAVITEEMLAKIAEYEVGEEDDENDYAPVEPISSEKGEDEEEKLSDEELAAKLLSDNFKSIRLDQENTLLRGSFLRNTEWVIGVAIFTGAETKIMLNAGTTPSKRSRIEKLMNRQVSVRIDMLIYWMLILDVYTGGYQFCIFVDSMHYMCHCIYCILYSMGRGWCSGIVYTG
jgi:phospholipid-translocating ATPase